MSIETKSNSPGALETASGNSEQADKETKLAGEKSEDSETSEEENSSEQAENDDANSDETDSGKPKKNGFKKRIDKLNKRYSAKEQEAEYWKAEALKQRNTQEPQQKEALKTVVADSKKPDPDKFDTHAEYLEALTDYKIELRDKERESKAKEEILKSEYKKTTDAHQSKLEEFKKAQPDYEEKLADFLEENEGFNISLALDEAIITSDNGPELVYALLQNPEELLRINKLGVVATAREIGKIEAKFAKSDSKEENVKKLTKAPPPISTVGSKNASSVKKSIYDPSLSLAEYSKLRREQMRKRA